MNRPLRLMLGLRARLLGALLLTSIVTLTVAALALLSPLEQRLKQSAANATIFAAKLTKPELQELPLVPGTRFPNQDQLEDVLSKLHRRAGGGVTMLDSGLAPVYSPSWDSQNLPDYFAQARLALRNRQMVHTLRGGELIVAEPIEIGPLHRKARFVVILERHIQYVAAATRVVRSAFFEAAVVGLAIALLLGLGLASTLLRRLRRLRDATSLLEQPGLEVALPVDNGYDEISELTRAFEGLRARLRSQEGARRAFVATASHELRTPLTSLHGMLELVEEDLREGQLDLEGARQRVARAREQTSRLSQLSTDLLDLTRLDAEVALRSEALELGELCRAVAAEFELQAAEQLVHLEINHPERPCWVLADPGAVARIVRILLDNALRFTPPGSSVQVRADRAEGWGEVLVCDEGPGVPEHEREPIFERFRRGGFTGGRGGFGLGLAIGRELAERMGGSLVLLAPAAQSPGARFRVRLPATVMATLAAERPPVRAISR